MKCTLDFVLKGTFFYNQLYITRNVNKNLIFATLKINLNESTKHLI